MPLSEDEQRILHEMEQKLYEHDRGFAERVRASGPRGSARRSVRWSVLLFIAGLAILLFSFRSSLLLGTFGFLVMVFSTLLFERSARQAYGARTEPVSSGHRVRALPEELVLIGRRLRSRFWRDH